MSKPKGRIYALIATIILLVLIPIGSFIILREANKARIERQVPEFKLTTVDGIPFTKSSIEGKVVISSFLFTRCQTPSCDSILQSFTELTKANLSNDNLLFLTLTIDPEFDTPEVLNEFIQKNGYDSPNWIWAYGPKEKVHGLIIGGFFGKVKYGDGTPAQLEADNKIVLINKAGFIRGYYEVSSEKSMKKMDESIQKYLAE